MADDWFSQFAVKRTTARQPSEPDWFAQFEPAKPATPSKPTTPAKRQPSWLESVGTFLGEATESLNPSTVWKGIQALNPAMVGDESLHRPMLRRAAAGEHPYAALAHTLGEVNTVQAIKGVLGAQGKLAEDAQKDFEAGDYGKGVVKALHYLIPMFGPQLQEAGESMSRGEIAKGLGQTVDIAGQIAGPKVLGEATAAIKARGGLPVLPKLGKTLTPAEQAAVDLGVREGVPVDAATATGNRAVRSIQNISDKSLGGSLVAGPAARAQGEGLATLGEQLASKGYGTAMTAEAAGQSLKDAVTKVVKQHAGDADYAYQMLREIEKDPSRARSFELAKNPDPVTGAPQDLAVRFAPQGAPRQALFDGVFADAQKQGWRGSKQELREAFNQRVKDAKALGKDMAAIEGEYSSEALLADIRKSGGLRPYDKGDYIGRGRGTTESGRAKLRGDYEVLSDRFRQGDWRHHGGGSIFRAEGSPIDELVQKLADTHPDRYADLDVNGLMSRLEDIAAKGPSAAKPDLETLLDAANVRPGTRWWEGETPGELNIGDVLDGKHLVRTETVPLGVDLRGAKQELRPLYESLMRQREVTGVMMGGKGQALYALDTLMQAPDVAPLSVVDAALGDLKAMARGAEIPELRTAGQGAAAQAVKHLDDAVRSAAREAGPDVVQALEQGRSSTIAKYDAAQVLDLMKDEPVATVRAITAAKDGGIAKLREVARIAPEELPKVGRSYLDGLLGEATAEGGFAKAQTVATQWQKLGPETKKLLFQDPGLVRDLDSFFLLAKRMSEQSNPSGTAHALINWTQGGMTVMNPATGIPLLMGQAGLSKLLHSRRGVQLLTQGLKMPVKNPASAKVAADLARYAGAEWSMQPAFAVDRDNSKP